MPHALRDDSRVDSRHPDHHPDAKADEQDRSSLDQRKSQKADPNQRNDRDVDTATVVVDVGVVEDDASWMGPADSLVVLPSFYPGVHVLIVSAVLVQVRVCMMGLVGVVVDHRYGLGGVGDRAGVGSVNESDDRNDRSSDHDHGRGRDPGPGRGRGHGYDPVRDHILYVCRVVGHDRRVLFLEAIAIVAGLCCGCDRDCDCDCCDDELQPAANVNDDEGNESESYVCPWVIGFVCGVAPHVHAWLR